MRFRILIALSAPFLLSACLAQSSIQGKYMDSQEDCRNSTARAVSGGETAKPVSESQTSPIAQRFADCMTKEGWHLSTPKPGTVIATNPPTGSPSTNPSAATVVAVPRTNYPPASSYPPNTGYGYYAQPATVYPPSGAPSVNPSAAAAVRAAPVAAAAPVVAAPVAAAAVAPTVPVARQAATSAATTAGTKAAASAVQPQTTIPTSPDVSTYQPGRPSGEAVPYYGTGPGRQF